MSKLRGVNVLWAAFSRMGTAFHEYVDRYKRRRRLREGDLFKSTDNAPEDDLNVFYQNQVGVRGYVSDEQEETDDSDLEPWSDDDVEWNIAA